MLKLGITGKNIRIQWNTHGREVEGVAKKTLDTQKFVQGTLITKGLYLKRRASDTRGDLNKLGNEKEPLEKIPAVPINDRPIGRNNNKFNSIRDQTKIHTRTKANCTVSKFSVPIKHKCVNHNVYPFSYEFKVARNVDLTQEKLAHRTAKLAEIQQYFIELRNTAMKY